MIVLTIDILKRMEKTPKFWEFSFDPQGIGDATKMKKGLVVKRVGFREAGNEGHFTVFSLYWFIEKPTSTPQTILELLVYYVVFIE